MPIHSLETQQNAGKLMWETQENFLSSPRKKRKKTRMAQTMNNYSNSFEIQKVLIP